MTPPTVGLGTLRRVGELAGAGRPVLSVYLRVQPRRPALSADCEPQPAGADCELEPAATDCDQQPPAADCAQELEALLAGLRPHAGDGDAERARQLVRSMRAPLQGTRGMAIFSTADGADYAVIPLPAAVEPMAVSDTVPWLEPLAGIFTSGDWGLAVLTGCSARLLRGGPEGLVEFATLRPPLDRNHVAGACSQLDARHVLEEHDDEYVQRVAELLLRAHRRRPFEQLTVAAPCELWADIERALDQSLRERLIGLVALELQDVPARELTCVVAEVMRQAERTRAQRCSATTATGPLSAVSAAVRVTSNRYAPHLSVTVPQHPDTARGRAPDAQLPIPTAAGA